MKIAGLIAILLAILICTARGSDSDSHTSGSDSDGHKDVNMSTESDSDADVDTKKGSEKNFSDTTDTNVESDSGSPVDSTNSDDNSDKEKIRKEKRKKLEKKLGMSGYQASERISFNTEPNALGAQEFTLLGHVHTVLQGMLASEKRNKEASKKIFNMWKIQHKAWDQMTKKIFEQSEEARQYVDSHESNNIKRESIERMEEIRETYARRKVEILQHLMYAMSEINKNHKSAEKSFQKLMGGFSKSLKYLGQNAKETEKKSRKNKRHHKR